MHPEARAYVASVIGGTAYPLVIEIGGRNINGTIRDLVPHDTWTSIDLHDGPDVDEVVDARHWYPPYLADLVVCCEVLEHSPDPEGIVKAAVSFLAPAGRLIITCAGPGREPHSTVDGTPHLREGEWYENIEPDLLYGWLAPDLRDLMVAYDPAACDVRATGVLR